ncbi:Retrovirus-related Pol polyprotein from transposon 17.6,Retrovirus-related Pol polyprotein from transposon opus,Retrovirus-related Pol polyprotein from transposon 297,Retrovirus-related Pol polyprotein from transposon gypsy [Mytilus edulis]|uniref:Uncharacterized protein n=1 Tax=Mytilus edulis TaxID=6550 RepID=A0A8S3R163_MYTED|nr:Retrovirus-related Pol polyprotein from transposon 17.6,Retrovirus-related Pol polyprotein from transposon opus,Retrovirus-related Pol polyprotein from transposon 297,Retrovirus-related Pol polyprotein from transposon gypsy [Mytilus edulis]
MEQIQQIRDLGTSLGYEDDELRRFVKDQQDRVRDERAALRQEQKDERDRKAAIEKALIEKAKVENEWELQKLTHSQKMEELSKQAELPQLVSTGGSHDTVRGPKIPAFEEGKDEIDSYLRRFERYATAQKWKPDIWATHLSALLKGKALDVYALMPVDKALDYPALKDALLKRYDMTEEGFKRRFRSCRPEPGETFIQFSVRLDSYFKRWIDMAHTDNTYISLYDLIIRDQFLHICSKDLSLFLKERIPDSLEKMEALADQYREARHTSASNLIVKGNQSNTSSVRNQSGPKAGDYSTKKEQRSIKPTERTSFVPVRDRKCFRCGKNGHIAPDCRVNLQKTNSGSSDDRKNFKGKVCNTCTIPTDSIVDAIPTGCTSTLPLSCQSTVNVSMPVSSGYVDGKPVTVLRETGCSAIVLKRDMVGNESLTGGKQGEFEGWCMANPVYDLIIGNVEDAREPGKPDPLWQQTGAVETREQVRNKSKPFVQLKVKDIITDEVNPNVIKKAQLEDTTLDKIRRYVLTGDTVTRKNGKVKWILKRGMIYRQFSSSKHDRVSCTQLVVPKFHRETVTRVAHESIMSGHMGTQRTLDRVLSAFYWPGVSADVKRFCQSCDICQRTVPKGKIGKVPLQSMPLIDEPFKRVAVDLIGPLFPRTDRGNRYILTLVDYATRYPEAIALKDIETESVAESLVDIFSRVGVPQEMLTDMGSQFTSKLMAEVSRLISLRQLTTTVYHPMCNGLVERFNGSLKLMLNRMCHERPKDWDRYVNALLFAYREVPQESLKFSPFEQHLDMLEVLYALLVRLKGANLTARPRKCSIGYGSLECLGHFVGDDKLKPHPDKVKAMGEAPRPVTKKQVRSFLGLVGFYRKCIPNFSCIALPLTDLTKKGQPSTVVWENAQENAFQSLRCALVRFPILKLPDFTKIFVLMTDASDRGIGAVLMQYQENSKMPIAYASRKLKKSEVAYSTIEKECLAIVWAVQKFQRYLYGREFILETDHQPLTYLNKKKVENARLMR